jgi:hypothetical protein
MARILCDVRGGYRRDFARKIEDLSRGEIEVVLTSGDAQSEIFGRGLTTMKRDLLHERYHDALMQDYTHTGANAALLSSPEFHDMAMMAVDHFQRMSPTYRYNAHNLTNLQDYLDYYYILTDVIARKLIDEAITHVVFFMVPHLGYDTVVYQVAKSLGIETIILNQQSLFNDRYFSALSIEDWGGFTVNPKDAIPVDLEQGQLPDLFFMDQKWQQQGQNGRVSPAAIVSLFTYVLRREPRMLLKPRKLIQTLARIANIYSMLPDWRDPFAKFFHTNALAYFEHLAGYEDGNVDFDKPFVYVPLHNQPEMSASTLGGRYRDQMLMIEAVARSIPDGWTVYVKENPRQGAYARGPFFFHRLNRLSNVKLVPSHTSSQALVAKSKLVATVAGTAGWEALLLGIPVVTFGGAWYRTMPGVTEFKEGLDFSKIANAPIDHDALKAAYGSLMGRSHKGLVDRLFFDKVQDFDEEKNCREVAQMVIGLVTGAVKPTFDGMG